MRVLYQGVKVTAIGSWYDQVVPLYSAIVQGIDHPGIFRALYIDAQDYYPDFLSHLVVLALKIRNAGYPDHGLLIHLSDVLAGSIYGFGTQGHSAIYEESRVYETAIQWALSSPKSHTPPSGVHAGLGRAKVLAVSQSFKSPLLSKLNPYLLPWIMAKLLASNLPKDLKAELDDVVEMYKKWDPKTKESKDLKYRLEGLKSKL
jgi:hypothetical protein